MDVSASWWPSSAAGSKDIAKDISKYFISKNIIKNIVDILDSEEQSDLNNAINHTLTKNPDNVSYKWKSQTNMDTNAEIIPLNSYKINQNTCRDFTKIVKKGKKQVQEKSSACRDEKGNWKII